MWSCSKRSSIVGILSGLIRIILKSIRVLSPPCLGDPASFIEDFSDYQHVVPEHALCHSDPVDLDVGAKSFHRLTESLWTAPSWEMTRGTITALATFFSRVSRVAHSRYFSSFSLKDSFSLSVDVIFTSTTTFFHSPTESRRSHTRSGFNLAPATRPLPFHSSDH